MNSTPPKQIAKFTWTPSDKLRYFHPVTGEEISRAKWRQIVVNRAALLNKGNKR